MKHHLDLLIRSPNMVLACLVELHAKCISFYRFGTGHQHNDSGGIEHIDFHMNNGSTYRATVYAGDYANFEKYINDIKIIKRL